MHESPARERAEGPRGDRYDENHPTVANEDVDDETDLIVMFRNRRFVGNLGGGYGHGPILFGLRRDRRPWG